MKRLFAILIIAALSTASFAQNKFLSAGVKAGMNYFSAKDFMSQFSNGKVDARAGFTGGFFAELRPFDHLSVSADLLYSRQSFRGTSTEGNFDANLDYLNIPILLNYYILDGIALKTGFQYGIKLSEDLQGVTSSNVHNVFRNSDLSIPIGASINFNFGLIIDVRYNFGVKDISYGSVGGIVFGKTKSNLFQITLGYRF